MTYKDWADKEQELYNSDEMIKWFEDREIKPTEYNIELFKEDFIEWHQKTHPEEWGND